MGEGIGHIITPVSAAWCGWTMLFLLVCGILAEIFQPGVVSQAYVSLWARTERTYKEAPVNFLGQLFVSVYRIGTLSFALCICLYTDGHCSFAGYSAVFGIVLAVLLIKMLCNVVLGYAFSLRRQTMDAYEHYSNITTIACLALSAAMLGLMRYGDKEIAMWVFWSVTTAFLLIWIYRSWQIFVSRPIEVVYLLIYMATLEILPISMVYYLSEQTISLL